MFDSRYYDNPFAEEEDDICYAEILSEDDDATGDITVDASARRISVSPNVPTISSEHKHFDVPFMNTEVNSATDHMLPAREPTPGTGAAENQEYAAHIDRLRTKLDAANTENSRLSSAQTKLEGRVRSLTLEKEDAEWQLQQEKERSRALSEKVSALEDELEQLVARASLTAAAAQRAGTSTGTSATAPPHPLEASPTPAGHSYRRDPNAPSAQFLASESFHENSSGVANNAVPLGEIGSVWGPGRPRQQQPAHEITQPAARNQQAHPQARGPTAPEAIEAEQKSKMEQAAAVKQLEAQLLEHNQRRDDLNAQLQRLECMRARTVADRKKKALVERGLEDEEKAIGHIRLQLRSLSALQRW